MKALFDWLWDRPFRQKLAALGIVLLVVFAFFNDSTATIHLVFGQVDMPMYVALAVAGLVGLLCGVVLGHGLAKRERRHHEEREKRKRGAKQEPAAAAPTEKAPEPESAKAATGGDRS